jgi:hypothetical protein
VVEAFPVELGKQNLGSGGEGYTGIASTFCRVGFVLDERVINGKRVRRYRYHRADENRGAY